MRQQWSRGPIDGYVSDADGRVIKMMYPRDHPDTWWAWRYFHSFNAQHAKFRTMTEAKTWVEGE